MPLVAQNLRYTTWPQGEIPQISLSEDGPEPGLITIATGNAVEWVVALDGILPPQQRMALIDNPAIRLLSNLDPITFTDGWDGGMMAPGQIFRRYFSRPGTYNYTDGDGHTGQVIVTPYQISLPMVMR